MSGSQWAGRACGTAGQREGEGSGAEGLGEPGRCGTERNVCAAVVVAAP